MVKRIESAHREILFSVDRARTAAGPKNRDGLVRFISGVDVIVPEIEESVFEPRPSLAGFFAAAIEIGEEDLRRHSEYRRIRETVEQRRQECAVDNHVVV